MKKTTTPKKPNFKRRNLRTTTKTIMDYATLIYTYEKKKKRQISSLFKINLTQRTNPNINSLLKQAVGETVSQTSQSKNGTLTRVDS